VPNWYFFAAILSHLWEKIGTWNKHIDSGQMAGNEWHQRVFHVDGIRKSVQKIKNRFIRSFSATTLRRRASRTLVPAQTDLEVKYFYTVGERRSEVLLHRNGFLGEVPGQGCRWEASNESILNFLGTFSDAIDMKNTLVPFISRHLPGINVLIPCAYFFSKMQQYRSKKISIWHINTYIASQNAAIRAPCCCDALWESGDNITKLNSLTMGSFNFCIAHRTQRATYSQASRVEFSVGEGMIWSARQVCAHCVDYSGLVSIMTMSWLKRKIYHCHDSHYIF
jgi:hypothetical protein